MTDMQCHDPEKLGLSPAGLARADAHIKSYIDRGLLPGGLLLVARQGKIAHVSAQGLMDIEQQSPVALDTIYRIYSMTKPVTSAALMMLFEEGRVQLDDPVAKFISEFAKLGVFKAGTVEGGFFTAAPARPMSVRDLLTHQSGLTYGFQQRTNVDAAYRTLKLGEFDGTLADWVDVLTSVPLEFSPGQAWNYSVSTDVVGRLIEVISGQRFDEFIRTRIFAPLGMTDTGFFVPEAQHDRFASCYRRAPTGKLVHQEDLLSNNYRRAPQFLSGGGGLVSTASDYFRFAQMLLNGGHLNGHRLLGRKTVELMTSNHLEGGGDLYQRSVGLFSETSMAGIGFGLGVSVMLDPAKALLPGSPGEFAWGGAASTYFWADPKEELIVIFMTQFVPSSALNIRRELRSIIYGALT